MSTFRWAVEFASAAMCFGLLGCGSPAYPPSHPSPLLQRPVPDFKRPGLDGSVVDTQAARGKTLVVKFFAKYCEPCKRTLPAVESLHKAHGDVVFIGVSEDESEADAKEIVGTYGLTFPVVHDRGNVLSGRYRVSDLPITFVVDATGKVSWVGGPAQTEEDLKRAVVR